VACMASNLGSEARLVERGFRVERKRKRPLRGFDAQVCGDLRRQRRDRVERRLALRRIALTLCSLCGLPVALGAPLIAAADDLVPAAPARPGYRLGVAGIGVDGDDALAPGADGARGGIRSSPAGTIQRNTDGDRRSGGRRRRGRRSGDACAVASTPNATTAHPGCMVLAAEATAPRSRIGSASTLRAHPSERKDWEVENVDFVLGDAFHVVMVPHVTGLLTSEKVHFSEVSIRVISNRAECEKGLLPQRSRSLQRSS